MVLGAWNRAILTPAWIGQSVLGLAPNSPTEILVPLDGFAPFQVRHNGVTVIPVPGQLLFQLDEPSEPLLARGMEAAQRAISELPRTPLHGCGINIRYSSPEAPISLLTNTRCSTEQLFSDRGYELRVRRRGETLAFKEGSLNVIADIPTIGQCKLTLNFERQGTSSDQILPWLLRPAAEYIEEAARIIELIAR